MMTPNPQLLDHFDNPRGAGSFGETEGVRRGQAGSEHHGAVIRIELRCDGATVADARFKAWGCPATIACASLVAEWVRGRTLADARAVDVRNLADPLQLPIDRLYAPLLVEDALRAAATEEQR
ncbi:MAG: iron-sulfur cluster assembly scaffold protein [Gammaproteobacteria bacterium]